MQGFFIVIVVGVIVFAIVYSTKQRARAKLTWAGVAREHGLEFRGGGTFANPSLFGIHEGYRVAVDTVTRGSGKSNQSYTRYRVHYKKLGVAIRLTREVPILGAIGKMFGGEDHQTGDAEFDDNVIVRAPDEQRALRYLTRQRRRAIETFLSAHKNAVITDRNATFETLGLESRAAALERGLRLLAEIARELDPTALETPPPSVRAAATGVAAAVAGAGAVAALVDPAVRQVPPPLPVRSEPAVPVTLPEPVRIDAVPDAAPGRVPVDDVPVPVPVPEPPPAAPPVADAEATAADTDEVPVVTIPEPTSSRQQDVCEALFAESGGLSHAKDVFAEDYADVFVHWTGTLKSARHYYSDLVFGSKAGTRAEVVVARIASGILGEREVVAVLQFPDGAHDELAPRVGKEITFEGDLASVDPFMRNVFVRNAALVD